LTEDVDNHGKWTASIITSLMLGATYFFKTTPFHEMVGTFRKCIRNDNQWFQVSQHHT